MNIRSCVTVVALLSMAMAVPAGDVEVSSVYPLATCPVTGEALGSMGDPAIAVYDGQEVRFCCGGCQGKFEADEAGNIAKVRKAIADGQREGYALATCPVSGQALGSMGEPVEAVVSSQLVKLCCAGCEKALREDPAKHVSKVAEAAAAAQRDAYPADTCPVSGQRLDSMGGPHEVIVGGRLVRLCCAGCVKGVEKDPAAVLKGLEEKREGG